MKPVLRELRCYLPARIAALGVVMACVLSVGTARAQAVATQEEATPRELKSVKVDEKLDSPLPRDATFHDQDGKLTTLGSILDGKRPTLLTFAYFNCPVLCSLILNSAVASLVKVPWTIGKEFDVVTISIDPAETSERAKSKRDSLLAQYGRGDASHGWHFLMGSESQIARVADAVGYRFHYDDDTKQYAHPATLILIKPDGRVSRYLYGLEYPPTDMRLGLLEASQGKLISTAEQILMFCYRYDAHQGKYVVMATRVMQIGAGGIALVLGGFLGLLWLRERKKSIGLARDGAPSVHRLEPPAVVPPMETRT
jgi:protein SCO1